MSQSLSIVYTHWLLKYRWPIVAVMILLGGVLASGARFLQFDTSYQVYFRADNPQLLDFERLQDTYSRTDNILVVLAPEDRDVFSPATLTVICKLTADAWQIPYASRVDSICNFQHTEVWGDELRVGDLVKDSNALKPADLERVRRIALSEPELVNRLVSPIGHVTAINIGLRLPDYNTGEAVRSVAEIRQLLQQLNTQFPHVRTYLTGGAVMDVAFPSASQRDMQTLLPLVFLMIIITMSILLRSLSATLITITVIGLASATGMGIAGWLGFSLNPTSVGAATIIATLAVADSIHILSTLLQRLREGDTKVAALQYSLQHNARPVLLTTLTTVIGFLSMNVSDSPPFNDLGNITAFGIGAAFVYSVVLLPALVGILPIRVPATTGRQVRFMLWLADRVMHFRKTLLVGFMAVAVVLTGFITRIEIDDRFVEYFSASNKFRQDTEFTDRNLTGIYAIEYSMDSGEKFGIYEPRYLEVLAAFSDWLYQLPEVVHVSSIVPILKRLNQNMHADNPDFHKLPRSRELAAQYILMYEISLPYGLDLTNQIKFDKSASRLTVMLRNMSTTELRTLERRIANWLEAHAQGVTTKATGPSVMFAVLSERNIRTMLTSTALAVLLITITLAIALRSWRLGLLSIVPNVLPTLMAFGVWALIEGTIGLVVSVISAMVLGIIVDDTVHFLSRYQEGRRIRQLTVADAVRDTFAHVGTAIWITSAVLASGFSLLVFSDFTLSSETGLISALTIVIALLADLLFLPPLLMALENFFYKQTEAKPVAPPSH